MPYDSDVFNPLSATDIAIGLQILCALVFGKKEDGGGFEFTPTLVDDTVKYLRSSLTGDFALFLPTVPAYFLRPLVHLCISGTQALSPSPTLADSG